MSLLGHILCLLGRHAYSRIPLGGPSKRHCLRDWRGQPCPGWRYFGAFL